MKVRINPPGHRKVSDMIWLVAESLLDSAPDYESKEIILKLTTLAWNFTLPTRLSRERCSLQVADLFQCPKGNGFLAERKALLFPEKERVICKVEMEPPLYGELRRRCECNHSRLRPLEESLTSSATKAPGSACRRSCGPDRLPP